MAITQHFARRSGAAVSSAGRRLPTSVTPAAALSVAAIAGVLTFAALVGDPATYQRTIAAAVLLGLLVPAVAAPTLRAGALTVAALTAGWLVIQGLYAIFRDWELLPPVSRAVGAAAYFGTSYVPVQLASALALALALAVAVAVRLGFGAVAATAAPAAGERRIGWVVTATALVWLALVPDIPARVFGPALVPIPYVWDTANQLAWNSFIERGAEPVEDFFYPYGHAWIFEPTPWGPVWRWLAQGLLLGLAAWTMWRLTAGRAVRVILGVVAVAVLMAWTPFTDRYLPGLLIATTYAALGPGTHLRLGSGHAVFAVVALYATWLEPDLLLLGLAGVACILAGEVVAGRLRGTPRDLGRRLAVDVVPLLVVALVPLLWLAEGTWSENWRFWTGLRAASAASATDANLYSALAHASLKPMFFALAVGIPMLMLVGGLALGRLRIAGGPAASMLFLAGAGASEILLLKHLVRPAPELVFLIALPVLLWAAIVLWDRRSVLVTVAVGGFAGTMWVAVQTQSAVSRYIDGALAVPARVVDNLQLAGEGARIARAERDRYAATRLAGWPDPDVAGQLRALTASSPDKSFAVLGDMPMLYTLLDQPPPYHVQLYDASRIEEQRAVVADLRERRPAFLVWRRDVAVDGVPQAVRTPLILAYAIREYVPVQEGGAIDILRHRRPSDAIPAAYWRSRIGDVTDLGFVPSASGADDAPTCSGGADCVPYGVLEGQAGARGGQVDLRITGRGQTFAVRMRTRPGVTAYPVRLDRLWFAPFVGPDPQVAAGTPGWTARREGRRTGDELY
jgi:hypothetical protein